MKKVIALLLCGVLLLAISSSASAVIAVWYETYLPTIGEKTVTQQTRESSSVGHATNEVGASDIQYVGWLQAQISGSWVTVSDKYTLSPYDTKDMDYTDAIPTQGTMVRLRTKPNGISAFQTICGWFDAN